jgi:adenylate cyclase
VVVQSLEDTRPPEIGPDLPASAAYAFMLVENSREGPTARWIVIDRSGNELRRIPPQPTTFDPRKRPWYALAMAGTDNILTPPYRFANVPEAGITLARQSRRTSGAVFGIDMTLASLDQYLDKLRFPPELELLVFDSEGALIAHPRGGSLRQIKRADVSDRLLRVEDLGSPLLSGMYGSYLNTGVEKPRSVSFLVGDEKYFGRSERVGDGFDNLLISLAIPYETMLKPAELIASKLLLVSGASVVLTLLIVLIASRRLALPLRVAANDIRRIMKFEFGHPRRIESRVMEVRELSRAIDTLELALSNFMRYVPTALVRGIIGRKFSSDLGGIRQPITVLFTDVFGFTTMAESLNPEEVMAKTSRYFNEIGTELIRSGATIDKYIGDSVMAFWNAPERRDDHVSLACLGALRASRRLDALNAKFLAEGGSIMRTRFGIHTGDAVVGNVGSVDRINYTALGHTVNMASRFEKMNKLYGTTILVSEEVRAAAGDTFVFRFVDRATPEGAHMAMALYELIGAEIAEEPELRPPAKVVQTLARWTDVIAATDAGFWEKAVSLLEGLAANDPEDMLIQVYLKRCRSNGALTPPLA